MKKTACISILLVATLALVPGCTNKEGETEAPVFLTVSVTSQPTTVFVDLPPLTPVLISGTVASRLKNPSQTDPQGFADTMLETYIVHFRRVDGGTRVPPDQTLPAGVLVTSGGSTTFTNQTILPAFVLQQSPFDQLLPFNGGFDRETGRNEIDLGYDLTFFGHTVSGQRVQSQTATSGGPLQFRSIASVSTARNSNR